MDVKHPGVKLSIPRKISVGILKLCRISTPLCKLDGFLVLEVQPGRRHGSDRPGTSRKVGLYVEFVPNIVPDFTSLELGRGFELGPRGNVDLPPKRRRSPASKFGRWTLI